MKFCENCGAQLADDAVFCGECGTKQSATISSTLSNSEMNPHEDQTVESSTDEQNRPQPALSSMTTPAKREPKIWVVVLAILATIGFWGAEIMVLAIIAAICSLVLIWLKKSWKTWLKVLLSVIVVFILLPV